MNLNNHINQLDNYTQKYNSFLLNLLRKSNIYRKRYIKAKRIIKDKELENILTIGKHSSSYNKNKVEEEKLQKMKILLNDNYMDFDVIKLLQERNENSKTKKHNIINLRKYNMMKEDFFFANSKSIPPKNKHKNNTNDLMSEKEQKKKLKNDRMKKIREHFRQNFKTIVKLKNLLK
jgi:hypothetical protein